MIVAFNFNEYEIGITMSENDPNYGVIEYILIDGNSYVSQLSNIHVFNNIVLRIEIDGLIIQFR